jgi:polar amino acid transport system substrate-binding protein
LIVVLLGAGLLIWIFERKENAEEFGHGSVSKGLGDGFWWSAVTMTTVGYGDKAPKTTGGRVVGLIWMFTSLIIIASFTASIAASLTANRLSNDRIRTQPVSELRVATVENSSALNFVRSQGGTVQACANLEGALSAVRDGNAEIVVYDAPILKWWIRKSFQSLGVGEQILVRDDYGFAFAKNSPLRKQVNTTLLKILREPVWQGIKRRYLGDPAQ